MAEPSHRPVEYKTMWQDYFARSRRQSEVTALDPGDYEFHDPCFLLVDIDDLHTFAEELVAPLTTDTDACLKGAALAMDELVPGGFPKNEPHGLRLSNPPRDLVVAVPNITAKHVGKLWTVEGTVRSCGPLESLIVQAVYACEKGHEFIVNQGELFIRAPGTCPVCLDEGLKRPSMNLTLKPDRSVCRDVRLFDIQDHEGGISDTSLVVMALDDLAVRVKTGHHVRVTGVLHLEYKDEKRSKATFPRLMKANNIEWQEVDYGRLELTSEEEVQIKELAARPDVWEVLARSIAPSILGNEDVKKGLALMMFSVADKVNDIRRCVNILLFGDRGTAKSELMADARRIMGRGVTASGNNATVAGITAGAEKDERLGGKMVVRPGAMVLAHGGLLCLDELEKMKQDVQDAMHTAMEQQVVHKVAVGINMEMDCACSVLAAANPIGSAFNENLAISEQTKLDGALLERFDLVFIFRMHHDPRVRKAVKDHIASGYRDGPANPVTEREVSIDLFRKYLRYAKKMCANPVLTPEAETIIQTADDKAKARCVESGWPYGYRQYHAHLRLALASARMRLSPVIEAVDAYNAVRMFDAFLEGLSGGGRTDLGLAFGDRTRSSADKRAWVAETVNALTRDGGLASMNELEELAVQAKVFPTARELRAFIRRMTEVERTLFEPRGEGQGFAMVSRSGY